MLGAVVALAAAVAWSRRWGGRRASVLAVGGYATLMLCAMVALPGFHEVPGPLTGPEGMVLDGFPAEVLADFRVYTLVNQALLWAVIGVVSAAVTRGVRRPPVAPFSPMPTAAVG